MPVTINEFEVVPAQPGQAEESAGVAPAGAAAPLSPEQLREMLRRQAGRMARLRAH